MQYDKSLDSAIRSKQGSFFTPKKLADELATEMARPWRTYGAQPATICDLACGDGALLQAAQKEFPEACLVGCDIDRQAVKLARKRLPLGLFTCCDSLFSDEFEKFLEPPIAFIMNPPYLGGGKISSTFGKSYRFSLKARFEASRGNADFCTYFLRRAAELMDRSEASGTISGIYTQNISRGDTRGMGLKYLVDRQWRIYSATTGTPWPGDAKVHVSLVHLLSPEPFRLPAVTEDYSDVGDEWQAYFRLNKPKPSISCGDCSDEKDCWQCPARIRWHWNESRCRWDLGQYPPES